MDKILTPTAFHFPSRFTLRYSRWLYFVFLPFVSSAAQSALQCRISKMCRQCRLFSAVRKISLFTLSSPAAHAKSRLLPLFRCLRSQRRRAAQMRDDD